MRAGAALGTRDPGTAATRWGNVAILRPRTTADQTRLSSLHPSRRAERLRQLSRAGLSVDAIAILCGCGSLEVRAALEART